MVRFVAPCLVVLVGPSASGKSTWAAGQFAPHEVVSSDAMRALVGSGPHDQRAGGDAFELIDDVADRRLRRRLVTVIDTTGLERVRRARWREMAARHGVACYAVAFDTPAAECRARNRARDYVVPSNVLTAQLRAWESTRETLAAEGFDAVVPPFDVRLVPRTFATAAASAVRQKEQPVTLRFGLQLPRFPWDAADTAVRLAEICAAAEDAGFSSLWVMDHFVQIPQVGREWESMLESWTTLGFLAAHTRAAALGTLVTGITYRNVAHVAKLAATLDALSNGRAVCGVGAAWFQREHELYGWDFPPAGTRYTLLEDALQLFPLMWGPGSPRFEGRAITIPEAVCYPRPVQERIPILVGGSGERRTLRLVARYADACNLFGDPPTVAHKVEVLRKHCADAGRDPSAVEVTHLGRALVGEDAAHVKRQIDALLPRGADRYEWAAMNGAATVDDHIGRFRELADAGVQTAIASLPDIGLESVRRFGAIVEVFSG
jgi:F420-dependent oxidoreductase-like protein